MKEYLRDRGTRHWYTAGFRGYTGTGAGHRTKRTATAVACQAGIDQPGNGPEVPVKPSNPGNDTGSGSTTPDVSR